MKIQHYLVFNGSFMSHPDVRSSSVHTNSFKVINYCLVSVDGVIQNITSIVHNSEFKVILSNGVLHITFDPWFGQWPRMSYRGHILWSWFFNVAADEGEDEDHNQRNRNLPFGQHVSTAEFNALLTCCSIEWVRVCLLSEDNTVVFVGLGSASRSVQRFVFDEKWEPDSLGIEGTTKCTVWG